MPENGILKLANDRFMRVELRKRNDKIIGVARLPFEAVIMPAAWAWKIAQVIYDQENRAYHMYDMAREVCGLACVCR